MREAHGAVIATDRPHALDLLGFASQRVFTTFCLRNFGLDQGEGMALCCAAADAHNRMPADFCRIDAGLLAAAYVPLEDLERARATTAQAIRDGAKELMVASRCRQRTQPDANHAALQAAAGPPDCRRRPA